MSKRQTQSARILELLSFGREVSALELSAISLQYCARIAELREAGAVIANRVDVRPNGARRRGFYRLIRRPPFLEMPRNGIEPKKNPPSESVSGSLFQETKETFRYPD